MAITVVVLDFDQPPVLRVEVGESTDLTPGVTIAEGVAMAYGMSPEGGSTQGRHTTRSTESPLGEALVVRRGLGAGRWGFFLRAETMHGWYTYLDDHASSYDPDFHAMSHGESFLAVLQTRFDSAAFYCD